jgi:hypothetical protein
LVEQKGDRHKPWVKASKEFDAYVPLSAPRYVAVCDVLGFEKTVESTVTDPIGIDGLSPVYAELLSSIRDVLREYRAHFSGFGDGRNLVHHAVFSDTIFVWSKPLDPDSSKVGLATAAAFFGVCNEIIGWGILHHMFIRAGIAYGKVCICPRKQIFLGQPIVDAYKTERNQKWIGGACHPSCYQAPHFEHARLIWHDVVQYEVPTKCGKQALCALNWARITRGCLSLLEEGKQIAAEKDKPKYDNASLFFRYVNERPELRLPSSESQN